jgi:hypothetical protein
VVVLPGKSASRKKLRVLTPAPVADVGAEEIVCTSEVVNVVLRLVSVLSVVIEEGVEVAKVVIEENAEATLSVVREATEVTTAELDNTKVLDVVEVLAVVDKIAVLDVDGVTKEEDDGVKVELDSTEVLGTAAIVDVESLIV